MQEQEKRLSPGPRSATQERKKVKAISSSSMPQEQGKGNTVTHGAKRLAKLVKGSRATYSSDAERKLDGVLYRLGDMVWGKVKSHPWWPGQLYDPALASASAMEFKRESCVLVAFFGDCTFGWFAETELIPYEPNFLQKSKQTSAPNFVDAVEDSLDEVRRRVRRGLTCHCPATDNASENEEKRDGLIYDRQLYDIRRGFEPAKLLSAIKQLACSPFSFPQNMLRNTITGAQTDAFRVFVSLEGLPEHKEIDAFSKNICAKGHNDDTEGTFANRLLPRKDDSKKRRQKLPSVSKSNDKQEATIRTEDLDDRLEGINELIKRKKNTKSIISKKRGTEKRKESYGDNGTTKGTVSELNNGQSGDLSAVVSSHILTNNALSEERCIGESAQSSEQLDEHCANVMSDGSTPRVVELDALAPSHNTEHIALKVVSNAVPEAVDVTLCAIKKERNAGSKKSKARKEDKEQDLKLNAIKKVRSADVDLTQAMKKVKVVNKAKDRRILENETEDSCREIKKRKVLRTGRDEANDGLDDRPGDSTASGPLPASDAAPLADKVFVISKGLQSSLNDGLVEPLISLETGATLAAGIPEMILDTQQVCQGDFHRQKHVNDDAIDAHDVRLEPVSQANEPCADADCKAVSTFQTGVSHSISEKIEEKRNASDVLEQSEVPKLHEEISMDTDKNREIIVSTFQTGVSHSISEKIEEKRNASDVLEQSEVPKLHEEISMDTDKNREIIVHDASKMDNLELGVPSNCDCEVKQRSDEEVLEPKMKAIDNKVLKDSYISSSNVDSTVAHVDGFDAAQAFACGAAEDKQIQGQAVMEIVVAKHGQEEKMQNRLQSINETASAKYGQEGKSLSASIIDSKQSPASTTTLFTKKRAVRENLMKGSKAKNKRIKSAALEKTTKLPSGFEPEDGEKQVGLNMAAVEGTRLKILHEDLMSLAAKPVGGINKEFSSSVCRAFTNLRKVLYKKAVCQTGPDNLLASSPVSVSQGLGKVGNGNNEVSKLITEQTKNNASIHVDSIDAELCILEDARTRVESIDSVSQKQSEEGRAAQQATLTKGAIAKAKPPSSSSISLRPAVEAVIPVCGPKEVLNRFGQRVPRTVDAGERASSHLIRAKSFSDEDLVISFPYGYTLPSEKQLSEVFMNFGELNISRTRVDSKSGCAHVVFRNTQDAEAALSSMKVNPAFEHARYWLKPRDVNWRDKVKLANRNVAFTKQPVLSSNRSVECNIVAEKPILSSIPPAPSKIAVDEERSRNSSDKGLLPISAVADKTAVHVDITSMTTQGGGKESALQSTNKVTHTPSLLMNVGPFQKVPAGTSGSNRGRLDDMYTGVVASSSVILKAGPRSLASPIAADISEPFLALLHQLHDLVLSTGFVM